MIVVNTETIPGMRIARIMGLVQGNTVYSNSGWGLFLGEDSGYTQNVISSNMNGTVTGGVEMGTNACNGTTTCP